MINANIQQLVGWQVIEGEITFVVYRNILKLFPYGHATTVFSGAGHNRNRRQIATRP